MKKNHALFLLFFISTSDFFSQKWMPGPKGLESAPRSGVVFKDNIYLVQGADKGEALLQMGDTGFTVVAELTTKTSFCDLAAGSSEMYLLQKHYGSSYGSMISSFDGKKLKNISPPDSILSLNSQIVFKDRLFVNVDIKTIFGPFNSEWVNGSWTKNSTMRYILMWDGKTWIKQDLKTNLTDKGHFFVFKNILYYNVITFDQGLYLFRLEGNGWKLLLKEKTEMYSLHAICEFNSLAYFFDGSNETYFTFDGTKFVKKKWALEFDNYGSSQFFLIPFDSKLYLAGRYWCNIKDAVDVICLDGTKWKFTGPGLEGDSPEPQISVFLTFKETLYAFGDFGNSEKGFQHSAKLVK